MNKNNDSYLNNKKILLTGSSGFVGTHLQNALYKKGIDKKDITTPRSSAIDLRIMDNCLKATENIDIVMHLAGNVGGIGYNRENPGKLFYDNITMGINLIEASRINKVKKFVCIGTICAYPKFTPVPFKEEDLWNGYPEETNAPYGIAKKTLLVMLQSYRVQYNFPGIYLLPVNMYGPGDNFNPKSSHVIAALIKKIYDAKQKNNKQITVWGDGSATREFLYVKDAVEAIILATEKYKKPQPVNIGSGFEISIKELVSTIVRLMDYNGKIIWDTSKPNGQPRRSLETTKAKKEFGFIAKEKFETGLLKTIKWYQQHAFQVR
jgi:GDP-L-fucose synthase